MSMKYRADYLVRYKDPEDASKDISESGRLLTAASGATCSFGAFSSAIRTVTTALPTVGPNYLEFTVASPGLFSVGDQVEIILASGASQIDTVAAVDVSAGTLTLTTGDPGVTHVGTPIRLQYGSRVAMSEYGTPKVGDKDWGFQGAFANQSFPELTPGTIVEIEVVFIGAGGGLDDILSECHTIEADCEQG